MFSAVRRCFKQQSGADSADDAIPTTMNRVMQEVKEVLAFKADKSTVETIVLEKANKVDTEMCLRWVDLLHKMVNKVVLLLTTKLKTDIDVSNDNTHQRQNKKVQLLQQGLIISKWIESFDSQNINDFYFVTEKEKQPQKIQEVQLQFKRAIDEIEKSQLSPNLVEVNRALKKTKDSLDLRQDDSKMQSTLSGIQSPKRLKLAINTQERFEQTFDADQMIQDVGDRYNMYARSTRNSVIKGRKQSQQHPPRLSPRLANKSVEPSFKQTGSMM